MSEPTYSVSIRIRRTTIEFAHVSVPITDDLIVEKANGKKGLDGQGVMARAAGMGDGAAWETESIEVEVHPVQTSPPDRT